MGPGGATVGHHVSQDPVAQMNTFRSYVSMLADPGSKDENKLKAAQALSEDLEAIVASPQYPSFLEHAMKIFIKILSEGDPLFISEYNIQQLRKLILEMIHRLPSNDQLKVYLRPILSLMFRLLETDNEENVMVCLRIIIELHKTFRPQFSPEIQQFLQFVKNMYRDLPNHMNKIFEPRTVIRVNDLSEVNVDALLQETFSITPIHTEKKLQDGTSITYNVIPRAVLSLKVLTELPIIVVLMFQLYKQQVYQDVADFIPLIMNTIVLQPHAQHRDHESFNKEVFVDLIAAQIKTLSFLAYILKIYQEVVTQHSPKLVSGMLTLLALCPNEVAHLRKELLIATKHILALELRNRFVPHIDKLFDESLLFGRGWTAHETLRPLAYSTLADLVHHVRQQLDMGALTRAVHLFSKNIHDETLPTSIQTMSCKLLLNLVDCIRTRSDANPSEPGAGRDLLIRMLHVFVNKFKTIAQLQLPYLKNKQQQQLNILSLQTASQNISSNVNGPNASTSSVPEDRKEDVRMSINESDSKDKETQRIGFPPNVTVNYSVSDCRALVKTLVCGVKTITWGCASCKSAVDPVLTLNKSFHPKETLVFIRLVKWAMQALDIYTLNAPGNQQPTSQKTQVPQTVRSKEEKEVLEHFAGVFIMMNPSTFREIFSTTIDYVVERIYHNTALQIVANSFLANSTTSPIFATILVEYLLGHMEEMGTSMDRSHLYLKLFKLVFGSVSLFAAENEQMLKPHLHQIVNRSMELAMSAKDPYNYFLLLRALFRSIGGGSHDLLYQEFLPLLPTLLQGLNSLQSGLHKQHMKDLFVELCLTVPVRLSSLLPYLPMLMDPLVSALNGSQTLISQGLRTLELCVDNLQPDFLYEHIQPVRAELMQALWKTLRNPNDTIAQVAFRVLGKFGGGNRKMMIEPQKLEYSEQETPSTCVTIQFSDHKAPITLPAEKIIETAFTALKTSNTEPWYRRQCWEVIRCFLIGSMQFDEEKHLVNKLFTHPSFREGEISTVHGPYYKCNDDQARQVHQMAVTAMFVAAAIKDLRQSVLPTMVSLVRHYTMVAIAQQAGPFNMMGRWSKVQGMDPLVLIDALAVIMGHEEKELCKPGHLALVLIMEAATNILGTKERACQLPLMEYLVEKMCGLCYERAWYAKLGGCIAIKFLFERMALKWVLEHQFPFLRALLFVMMDLTGEVSSGAVDMAKNNLERMLRVCGAPLEGENSTEDMRQIQNKSLHDVTHELVRQVTSPNTTVREQAMQSLHVLAKLGGKGVTEVMQPHKDVLADMIPPKKHPLRQQPANVQIGLMDGNTFCTTLEPRLFTLDLSLNEHKFFFTELHMLVETEDSFLAKLSCYKNIANLVPLRKSALKALAACHYIPQIREKIFPTLYKALNNSSHPELQETAFECLKKFQSGCQIDMEMVHTAMRPLLGQLCHYRSVTLPVIHRLSYLTQLFPYTFNEKLCEQLTQHVKNLIEMAIVARKQSTSVSKQDNNDLKLCANIVGIFHQIPAASARFVEVLCKLVLQTERALLIEAGSPFREPLMKFLLRYPAETVELFLSDPHARDQQWARYLEYLVRHKDNAAFRQHLQSCIEKLLSVVMANPTPVQIAGLQSQQQQQPAITAADRAQLQYLGVRVILLLSRSDDQWLSSQTKLVVALRNIWVSDEFQERHHSAENTDFMHWKEPRMVVSILLMYFKLHTDDIKLLFQLLRAFIGRFIPDFQFLRDFLEQKVAQTYSVDWKRSAFFQFVEVFEDVSVPQELKARILQYIIIPCLTVSLECGDGEKLIGYPPAPDQDYHDNVVSVFITRVINPDEPFVYSDAVRILLLQLSCLLVEQASAHIHDAGNKRQGQKLRRLMTFAWPCLLSKNCVDPATKYHGHLLLSHIIAKFAIHKRIVLQVFHSLLKAHAMEARSVVRQALEILTPAMPVRMEDGNTMLTHWTRKILVEEGHSVGQLVHILQLVVRHANVYYPVRHHLTHHITQAMHRLGFTPTANLDQRRLAVDLAEVCIKWEEQRVKEEVESYNSCDPLTQQLQQPGSIKRSSSTDGPEAKRARVSIGGSSRGSVDVTRPMEKSHADAVVYFLLRLACQVNESTATPGTVAPGEALSRRCVCLLKRALKPDMWPHADPKLAWLDKLFLNLESAQPNLTNVCVGLEVFTYLIGTLRREQILGAMRGLTRGLVACMTCSNSRVVRLTHSLLDRLMSTFPTEPTSATVASRYEELEDLYSRIAKIVFEGLSTYEKNATATPTSLFGTLMILKAACQNNPCYIDRLIMPFMKVLQRMAREHLSHTSTDTSSVGSELLILSLDLVKKRVGVMGVEMRKAFIGTILVGLIEKTPDVKVMKAITKMVEEWVKNKSPIAINQGPSLREKSILLVKLMQYVEKRFSEDSELMAQFLELVNHVYRDDTLRNTELTAKLEPAFLAGLRCTQPPIRAKFFQVFHESMRSRLNDRLLYIICSQNWDHMGPHYWIKQCIQLLLVTALAGTPVQNSSQHVLLPGVTAVISWADAAERANFSVFASIKEEASDLDTALESTVDKEVKTHTISLPLEDEIDIELSSVPADGSQSIDGSVKLQVNPKANLHLLLSRQAKFMEGVKEVCNSQFLSAMSELCHMDTSLAEWVWLHFFPRLWKILSEKQQQGIASEVIPFLCSGSHVIQKDCHPSALHTFTEALAQCQPPITIRPAIMKYLGKSHNLWHRMTLLLEQLALEQGATTSPRSAKKDYHDTYDMEPVMNPQQEILDSLSEMYSLLKEEDLWAGLWQTVAHYPETRLAVTHEQHGFLEQAQATYELSMSKARTDMAVRPSPGKLQSEMKLWEDRWLRCAKELNQWDLVQEYGSSEASGNPLLVLESAWRVPNWARMKEALAHVEQSYPKELAWKINLYRGYLAICHPEEEHLKLVEKLVEAATVLCIREWKRLPHIVSHIHLPYLQAAQQVMELQEACQIHQGLVHGRTNSLHDMKAIVKTWRNRLPVIADDLSHWSDIFTWRQHHYQFIVNHYTDSGENQSMLGVHASAQAIIHFGKIARKHNLSNVCLESLSRIHTIPSVPVVDCFQKIRQQVKCYHQMATATGMGKNELQGGLEVIESTNLKFFNKDMTAEFYALKGMFLSQLGRSEEANKALSAAVQLHDTLVKAWALWGDYLEALFTRDPTHTNLGVFAITCYLHASRHQNESKSRKYLAKVLWLLSYDDDAGSLSEAVDRYCVGVPAIQWLPWIPQLLTCLVRPEGKVIINLLNQVGRMFPQAVYFPIRTLYLTLKIEQRGRIKTVDPAAVASQKIQQQNQQQQQSQAQQTQPQQAQQSSQQQATETAGSIKATEPMWRCSRIMHMQKELHPTVLASLEGIVDQMVCFREYWDEVVLRQLRQALAKCYAVAYENSAAVSEANITPHTLSFVKKLVSTFGIGIENISSSVSGGGQYASAASESLARRAQATVQDPVFHKMKGQFTTDFDFSQLGAMKLHNLIHKLKKWIKILEARVKLLPKWFLIEEKCRYLSNFSLQTAEVELPGEFLLPKHSHYYIRIARFMPRVDIVQKHGTAARRLHIRGHNGRVYPYLVVNDYSLSDARREERVLQLLRMLNHFFAKQKETSRRLVNLSVSRVVAVSPQMRLVEDNVSSLSLLDIYKLRCAKRQLEPDTPVTRYYERLAAVQARGSQASHQVLRDIVKEVQNAMVPRTMLRDWALTTYPNPTHYWTFRKILTVQLALIGLMEYLLHLTKLYPDMMYVHQDSGLINIAYFKFGMDDAKGELDVNRPVPFRLTPNLAELVTSIGVSGPFTASMVATARCLATPSFKVNALLRAIMRDEIITWHKRQEGNTLEVTQGSGPMEGEALITRVNKAVTAITTRIQSLASIDGADSKVTQLVRAVNCIDNLCRMDPAWHPWL
ncbi:transformation/transcription domain-associated protein isoform X4 [Procambarus clarkii]|uniref:transformation/transcription domain-associated protein isoform X4 n=1 Tax=Procambarus clarkii TaxID=6728 RepID=UPI001E677B28|nr:transformation/transcription domain-associated protein-like isoform X4 [Procambarus clarkii]